jgi:hypothetical protein
VPQINFFRIRLRNERDEQRDGAADGRADAALAAVDLLEGW